MGEWCLYDIAGGTALKDVAIGYKSLFQSGTNCVNTVAIGDLAMSTVTGISVDNIAIGEQAFSNVPNSSDVNIAIGYLALNNPGATVTNNVAIGRATLWVNQENYLTAVGLRNQITCCSQHSVKVNSHSIITEVDLGSCRVQF